MSATINNWQSMIIINNYLITFFWVLLKLNYLTKYNLTTFYNCACLYLSISPEFVLVLWALLDSPSPHFKEAPWKINITIQTKNIHQGKYLNVKHDHNITCKLFYIIFLYIRLLFYLFRNDHKQIKPIVCCSKHKVFIYYYYILFILYTKLN